jgi:hypothetical protein
MVPLSQSSYSVEPTSGFAQPLIGSFPPRNNSFLLINYSKMNNLKNWLRFIVEQVESKEFPEACLGL